MRPVRAGRSAAKPRAAVNNSATRASARRLLRATPDAWPTAIIQRPACQEGATKEGAANEAASKCPRKSAVCQNFTCGGACAPSPAANSAIGLLERNAVAAHNTPGNVLSSVL